MSDIEAGSGAGEGEVADLETGVEPAGQEEGKQEAGKKAAEAPPRRKRRGGLPDDAPLTAPPRQEDEDGEGEEGPEPADKAKEPKKKEGEGGEVKEDQPPAEANEEGDSNDPVELKIPDDHIFKLETDPERGPEDWTFAELKQAAQLAEEAVKWKGAGEQAVQQKNQLLNDIFKRPMETLVSIFSHVYKGDTNRARAEMFEHARNLTNEYIQYENLPEEKRQLMEKERQVQDLQARLQEIENRSVEAQKQREQQEAFQRTHNEIVTAINALGREPSDEIVEAVATVLDQAYEAGHENITTSMATKMVIEELDEQERERERRQWTNFDPAKVPPEALERLRAYEVERLKAEQRPQKAQTEQTNGSRPRRTRRVSGV